MDERLEIEADDFLPEIHFCYYIPDLVGSTEYSFCEIGMDAFRVFQHQTTILQPRKQTRNQVLLPQFCVQLGLEHFAVLGRFLGPFFGLDFILAVEVSLASQLLVQQLQFVKLLVVHLKASVQVLSPLLETRSHHPRVKLSGCVDCFL